MSDPARPLGPPPDPRSTRQRVLVQTLRGVLAAVVVLAAASVALGDERAHDLAVVMVAVLAAAPVVRLVWLTARWTTKQDWRFAAASAGLIALIGAAAAIGLA